MPSVIGSMGSQSSSGKASEVRVSHAGSDAPPGTDSLRTDSLAIDLSAPGGSVVTLEGPSVPAGDLSQKAAALCMTCESNAPMRISAALRPEITLYSAYMQLKIPLL